MADAFFRVFDEDNSGALNFYEYMMVKKAPNLDNPQEKLEWIFTAFDQDNGGTIDIDEVFEIVEALLKMSGKEIDWKKFDHEIQESVEEIIDAVDENGDGIITKDEFIQNAMNCQFVLRIFNEK